MLFTSSDPNRPGVACSRKGLENNCPKTCRHASGVCGNGCAGLLAQQLPSQKHSSCWSVGQWASGQKVSVSLLDPSNPKRGVVYTMLQGDSKGCPAGKSGQLSRSLSLSVSCPGVGLAATPVVNVSSLGNCAYAAQLTHPAACPLPPGAETRQERRPGFFSAPPALAGRQQQLAHPTAAAAAAARPSSSSSLGQFFSFLFGCSLLYCVLGCAVRASAGHRGLEALPNYALWRALAEAASAEVAGVLDGVRPAGAEERGGSRAAMPLLGKRDHAGV
jgi:hypothetical protein